jgi:hypothetical protein
MLHETADHFNYCDVCLGLRITSQSMAMQLGFDIMGSNYLYFGWSYSPPPKICFLQKVTRIDVPLGDLIT